MKTFFYFLTQIIETHIINSNGIIIQYSILRSIHKIYISNCFKFFLISFKSDSNFFLADFYSQWYHQTFFTVQFAIFLVSVLHCSNETIHPFAFSQLTELFSTTFVLHLANKENIVTSRKVLCIIGTSLLHIIAGSVDQFIQNVFLGEGK